MRNQLTRFFQIAHFISLILASSFLSAENTRMLIFPSGGATNVISARIIEILEARQGGKNFTEVFGIDEVGGSSSGAALATLMSLGYSGTELVEFFNKAFPHPSEHNGGIVRFFPEELDKIDKSRSADQPDYIQSKLPLSTPELKKPLWILAYNETERKKIILSSTWAREDKNLDYALEQCIKGACRIFTTRNSGPQHWSELIIAGPVKEDAIEPCEDRESWEGHLTSLKGGYTVYCADVASLPHLDYPGLGKRNPTVDIVEERVKGMKPGDSLDVFVMENGYTKCEQTVLDSIAEGLKKDGKTVTLHVLNVDLGPGIDPADAALGEKVTLAELMEIAARNLKRPDNKAWLSALTGAPAKTSAAVGVAGRDASEERKVPAKAAPSAAPPASGAGAVAHPAAAISGAGAGVVAAPTPASRTVTPPSSDEKHWACLLCTYENDSSAKRCAMCGTGAAAPTPASRTVTPPSSGEKHWACRLCTYENKNSARACAICRTPK
jgi:hypothetical protein